ncbi:MAG: hypothetical protein WD557_16020 [Dehalococcoidia bacterium]
MNVRMLAAPLALAVVLAACGGAESEPTPADTEGPTAAPSPTAERGGATGEVASGKSLRSSDGRLEVVGTGKTAFDVTVREIEKDAPEEPFGWALVGPVYDITAMEPGKGAIKKLTEPFELRFSLKEALATVIAYDGDSWVLVPSAMDGGVLEAETDHLSLFAVVKPSIARGATPTATATPTPTPTPAEGTPTDGTETRTPLANVTATATPVSAEVAAAALAEAIEKWRAQAATVTGAAGYAGTASMELPAPLEEALAGAGISGELYFGVYGGVNQAFMVGAMRDTVSGDFTVLIEPKLEFPSSSSEAQRMLAEYFPAATGQQFVAITDLPAMYAYMARSGDTFIVLGFIEHKGVPLAYLSVGSGVFVAAAVDATE